MSVVVVDANAVIMHGRAFPERVRAAAERGTTIVLPQSVKQEVVDDVLEPDDAPPNHRASAQAIDELVNEGCLGVRSPDFDAYSTVIDDARRRIADESLPEHAVQADQYIPAIVCELAHDDTVEVVTADRKLRAVIRDIAEQQGVQEHVRIREPLTVL